jgi:hypothetical protein
VFGNNQKKPEAMLQMASGYTLYGKDHLILIESDVFESLF